MTKSMQISLKPGERLFINGAVLRVDKKVTLELLNDATFLLESHVMQLDDTTTPLKQLYFTAQTIVIDPRNAGSAYTLFMKQIANLAATFENTQILDTLPQVENMISRNRYYEGLRLIRSLFPLEETILKGELSGSHYKGARAASHSVMESTL